MSSEKRFYTCAECGAGWIGGYRVHEEGCTEGMREAEQSPVPTPDQPEQGESVTVTFPSREALIGLLCHYQRRGIANTDAQQIVDAIEAALASSPSPAPPLHQRIEGLIAEFEDAAVVADGDYTLYHAEVDDARCSTWKHAASRLRSLLSSSTEGNRCP